MNIEAADNGICVFPAEQLFVPWLICLGRFGSHLTIIVKQLHANIHAFVADESGCAFKESGHFTFAQSTK